MSTSESYDTTKLLTDLNITNWDHHLREKLSAYPIIGKAIRKGTQLLMISSKTEQGCIRTYPTRRTLTKRVAKTS